MKKNEKLKSFLYKNFPENFDDLFQLYIEQKETIDPNLVLSKKFWLEIINTKKDGLSGIQYYKYKYAKIVFDKYFYHQETVENIIVFYDIYVKNKKILNYILINYFNEIYPTRINLSDNVYFCTDDFSYLDLEVVEKLSSDKVFNYIVDFFSTSQKKVIKIESENTVFSLCSFNYCIKSENRFLEYIEKYDIYALIDTVNNINKNSVIYFCHDKFTGEIKYIHDFFNREINNDSFFKIYLNFIDEIESLGLNFKFTPHIFNKIKYSHYYSILKKNNIDEFLNNKLIFKKLFYINEKMFFKLFSKFKIHLFYLLKELKDKNFFNKVYMSKYNIIKKEEFLLNIYDFFIPDYETHFLVQDNKNYFLQNKENDYKNLNFQEKNIKVFNSSLSYLNLEHNNLFSIFYKNKNYNFENILEIKEEIKSIFLFYLMSKDFLFFYNKLDKLKNDDLNLLIKMFLSYQQNAFNNDMSILTKLDYLLVKFNNELTIDTKNLIIIHLIENNYFKFVLSEIFETSLKISENPIIIYFLIKNRNTNVDFSLIYSKNIPIGYLEYIILNTYGQINYTKKDIDLLINNNIFSVFILYSIFESKNIDLCKYYYYSYFRSKYINKKTKMEFKFWFDFISQF